MVCLEVNDKIAIFALKTAGKKVKVFNALANPTE